MLLKKRVWPQAQTLTHSQADQPPHQSKCQYEWLMVRWLPSAQLPLITASRAHSGRCTTNSPAKSVKSLGGLAKLKCWELSCCLKQANNWNSCGGRNNACAVKAEAAAMWSERRTLWAKALQLMWQFSFFFISPHQATSQKTQSVKMVSCGAKKEWEIFLRVFFFFLSSAAAAL